ncbi:hypothetical protein EOC99_07050 [Mesorhizobium sp. M7A.T.Ca.TU.009.01.1.1]|nr:hypothetical protein EOC99_07050 [Mesorhizobium sp. M7A.T.Ca.TU.009.01.1.1]
MREPETIADFDPEEIDVQAVDGYHHGGNRFSASFELSDPDDEFSRSYLLEIELGATIRFNARLQIEDAIRSHVSFGPQDHVALELGGIIHDLPPGSASRTELREGALTRLWAPSRDRIFAIGDLGVSYLRERGQWGQLETFDEAVPNDIHGRDGSPVYCAGDRGLLLRLDGRRWNRIDVGVEENFNTVLAGPQGEVYLGGANGAAYELRDSQLIALKANEVDYYDICEFRGKRYWSDMSYGVSVQKGRELVPLLETEQGFTMNATEEFLVVAGWHEFFLFDGTDWSGFEMGYDGNIFLRTVDINNYR